LSIVATDVEKAQFRWSGCLRRFIGPWDIRLVCTDENFGPVRAAMRRG